MSLNLSTGGDFSPFLKYNAKAGRWFVRGENGTDVEIEHPRFAIDLENIRQGWLDSVSAGIAALVRVGCSRCTSTKTGRGL